MITNDQGIQLSKQHLLIRSCGYPVSLDNNGRPVSGFSSIDAADRYNRAVLNGSGSVTSLSVCIKH